VEVERDRGARGQGHVDGGGGARLVGLGARALGVPVQGLAVGQRVGRVAQVYGDVVEGAVGGVGDQSSDGDGVLLLDGRGGDLGYGQGGEVGAVVRGEDRRGPGHQLGRGLGRRSGL